MLSVAGIDHVVLRVRDADAAIAFYASVLGGVDKFEPVSGGGDVNHAEEALGELIISSGDGAVDFQTAEEALDVIALPVERPVMFDLDAAV